MCEGSGQLRRATEKVPRLPNFVIAGAAKSATTFLASTLRQHPDIFLPPSKEASYFAFPDGPPRCSGPGDEILDRMVVNDLDQYRELFLEAGDCTAVGEASVVYLARPDSFARMRSALGPGGIKVIVLLRNPADRAFSAWSHLVRDRRETLDFRAGLAAEDERMAAGYENLWAYRGSGGYADQLQVAFAELGRANVGVWLHDDLEDRPLEVVREICEFLGVSVEGFRPNTSSRVNASGIPRSVFVRWLGQKASRRVRLGWLIPHAGIRRRIKLAVFNANLRPIAFDPALRAELLEDFRGEIESLERLLGRNLARWFEPSSS